MKFAGFAYYWIWGLFALALVIYLLSCLPKYSGTKSQAISNLLRFFTLASLILALARPYYEVLKKQSSALVLLDISESMDEIQAQKLLERANKLQSDKVKFEVLPFSGQPASYSEPLSSQNSFRALRQAWSKLDIGNTNIEAALASLLAQGPASVVVISDGQQNSGNTDQVTALLKSSGFKLFPLLPKDSELRGVAKFNISQLHAPLVAPAKKSVDILTSLANTSPLPQGGLLEILHDGKVVFSQNVEVAAGSEQLFVAQSDPSSEGIKEITAVLKPNNADLNPSTETVLLSGQPREKVLLISGSVEDQRFIKTTLENQSYQLVSIGGESKVTSIPTLSDFSAVILNNIGVDQAPSSLSSLAEQYVRDGGGLIMVGGNRSFGLGGYKDTPIEKALPVSMLPPETTKKRLNVAVELVMDKSRSMAEGERLDFAKAAAVETIRNLKDDDFIGVMGFDASPFVVIDIAKVATVRDRATERVGRLFASGRTNLLPAIDEARRSLLKVSAGRKHMIILTDGKIPDEGPFYIELTKDMRMLGITMSTVLIGTDSDPGMLRTMANQGGGAFYQTADARNLPKIFLTDVKVNTGENTLKEDTDYLVRNGPGELVSTTIRSFPPVRGYVQTRPKDKANLELVTYGFDKAEPLLASWGYGQGRAIAFTSDASGRWSNSWVVWPRFATLWSDLVEWVHRRGDVNEALKFDLRYWFDKGALNLDLSVFSDQAPATVRGILNLPSDEKRQIDLNTISAGHYQAQVSNITAGKYEFRGQVDGAKLTPVAFFLPGTLFGEQKGQGFNSPFLYELAAASGGKVNPSSDDLEGLEYQEHMKYDLQLWPLMFGLIFFLLEIVRREIGLLKLFKNAWARPK